jgi:uncharacterized membrane protein
MDWSVIHLILSICQKIISIIGILIIFSGVLIAGVKYFYYLFSGIIMDHSDKINHIRLNLGRSLILGLEFIVAADLIGTTTTPDYYAVGLLAIIVLIRTLLTFSINLELARLTKMKG